MPFILESVRLFAGGLDLTTVNNKVELSAEVEEKDVTTFLAENDPDRGWKKVTGGLFASALGGEGLWEAGDVNKIDDHAWASQGAALAYTVCPDGAAVGDLAWLLQAVQAKYKLGAGVGDVAPWTTAAAGTWPLARGKVAHPPGTARIATGSGTAVELAAVSSSQYVYATLHVLSVAGTSTPTITVKIQSDVDATFATATDVLTFTAATAIGGQIKRAIGPITDTFFRAQWTISGSSPSFLALVAISVQ